MSPTRTSSRPLRNTYAGERASDRALEAAEVGERTHLKQKQAHAKEVTSTSRYTPMMRDTITRCLWGRPAETTIPEAPEPRSSAKYTACH